MKTKNKDLKKYAYKGITLWLTFLQVIGLYGGFYLNGIVDILNICFTIRIGKYKKERNKNASGKIQQWKQ